MTTMVRDDTILKVHVAKDESVWAADGILAPQPTGQSVADYVRSVDWDRPVFVRALGTQDNAGLITALYPRCVRSGGRLEVGSPLLCETAAEQEDPEIALYRMRQCLLSPSLGGWHIFGPMDYPAYALAVQLAADKKYNEHSARLLETHPVWYDLTFIGSITPAACASVIAIVLDPRWYIDPQHPERTKRLESYLGLRPETQRAVTNRTRPVQDLSRSQTYCRITNMAWGGGTDPPENMNAPSHFLWRRWSHHGGGVMGDLRATQAFVTYLARTWQHQICHRTGVQKIEMFLPEKLLTPGETRAYRDHASRRPNRV